MDRFSRFTRSESGLPAGDRSHSEQRQRYAGVELQPAPAGCCKAAQGLAGRHFLLDEAPLLPLPGCDRLVCNCRYKRLVNRRSEVRRDEDLGLEDMTGMSSFPNNRRGDLPGRRLTDDES